MSNALMHFENARQNMDVNTMQDPSSALGLLRKTISHVQQLTLSEIPDSTARQLGSILFSRAYTMLTMYEAVEKPLVVKPRPNVTNLLTTKLGLLLMSAAVAAAGISLAWNAGDILMLAFLGGAEALSVAAYAWPRKKDPLPEARLMLNTGKLIELTEKSMASIDRDLAAFQQLPEGGKGNEDDVLSLITKVVEMKRQDPASVPDEILTAVGALTIRRGYRFIEYASDTEKYFDVMPTKRNTRTIVPAVLKDDAIVSRGMAIVKMKDQNEGGRI